MFDRSRRNLFSRRSTPTLQRLPWVVDEETFVDCCTRCNKCLSACETQIIVKGDGGFPVVDFTRGECTFCAQCAEVCPEPLFHPTTEQPWSLKAQIHPSCLALNKIECRSCGDGCEVQAIRFTLRPGGVAVPELDVDRCNGCGACLPVCPASAISMFETEPEEK